MHNDGVVQGLSEVPFMQDVERWGVLTIGTGLGNARFTNRRKENGKDDKKSREKEEKENGEKKAKKSKPDFIANRRARWRFRTPRSNPNAGEAGFHRATGPPAVTLIG